jgi:TolB-like protein
MADDPIHFGPFTFDPGRMTVARGGEVSQLGNRGALLLKCLADAGGTTVSREVLMNAAWPGTAVEEGNLTVQIATLRKILGRNGDGEEWIVNVPREGYRLLTGVEPRKKANQPRLPVVAVLPFHSPAPDGTTDYFADGIVTDITTALSRFRSFSVVSRNMVFAKRGRDADLREMAADLGADYLVEGDVRRAGERLRISVRLVKGDDALTIWAEQFDGVLGDVFEFQDRISEEVASRLEPAIEIAEIRRSERDRPRSFAAYDVYLRALAWLGEETEDGNRRAHDLLVQALELEPENPAILGHACWALEHRITMGWPLIRPDDKERCLDYARRGLAHGAGNPRVMTHCGMALLQTGKDYVGGLRVIKAAAAANPNDLFVACNLMVATMHCGDLDEALVLAHRALRLGPHDPEARFPMTSIAMIAIMRGDYEEAVVWATHSLTHNASFDATYWMLISANGHLGRMDEAKRYIDRLMAIAPGVTLDRIRAGQPARYPERIEAILEGLRLAGLQ